MTEFQNTSRRPYLLRAMHEWITDNQQTPYIVVDAGIVGVEVPREHVQDGKIILNVSYSAANALELGNDWVMFQARFSGLSQSIAIPILAVLAIYSKETGQGLIFEDEEDYIPPTGGDDPGSKSDSPEGDKSGGDKPESSKRSHLRVVK
ncbi:MAG: ClpXP protease specificity-enhancing factor [Gammaproteobacteria bacterium]|nr:ClpXP protease specificity-enhancing factor [Gammaproteobacteria bacterium]NNC97316.1 ClpXP protease specificity-enhancing factor [Gammaproteobacteria bacterium]NNM14660.1 ClpXP protease specificity-enhancing factor [Gammaproteobacteria bacterium]